MTTQKQVWNNIAQEWHEFKTKPARHVVEFLNNQEGKILDLGSGSGRHLQKIKGKMYLQDFSENMIELAKQKARENNIKAEFKVSELNKIPYDDKFFDASICISALHCIEKKEDRKKTIEELYRVLKKGSKAMIGVWNKESYRFKNAKKEKMVEWRNKGKRFYYLYEKKEVHDLFKKVGFKIIEFEEARAMINFIVEKQ